MLDVAIIGAGPAGIRLASHLSKAGYQVTIFDDRPSVGSRKICSGIISAETAELVDLPRSLIRHTIRRVRFVSPRGNTLDYQHPETMAFVVDRDRLDAHLAGQARAAGAHIQVHTRVLSVQVSPRQVRIWARHLSQPCEPLLFRARCLVLATGVHFRLHRELGLGRATQFLTAAQAHFPGHSFDCTHCYLGRQVAPGAFAWVVPLNHHELRAGLITEKKAAHYFPRLVQRLGSPVSDLKPDLKPIVHRFQGPTYADRVLAVGEAAGQIKTTTGGGIYYGLICADAAADILQEALRSDRLQASSLQRYENRWQGLIGRELQTGHFFRELFSRLSDQQIERLFQLGRLNGLLPLIQSRARFDWHSDVIQAVTCYRRVAGILGWRHGQEA